VQCTAGDAPNCLTAAQVETARTIYSPVVNPRTKQKLFGPLLPGGELAWTQQTGPEPFGYGTDFFRYLVMKDPSWHPRTRPVDFDRDAAAAVSRENQIVDVNPNLNGFIDRGGKLLFVGGWADGAIAPASNTDFYEAVARNAGPKRADSVRLFMVPDMGHCPAAPNARNGYLVDTAGVLEQWRQSGKAPDSIVVSRRLDGVADRKMLVCKYPQVAAYTGSGDPKLPESYACR
jgi:feruloyl esterase